MRRILLILILVFYISAVSGFPVNLGTIDDIAEPGDPAEFELTIENNMTDKERFSPSVSPNSYWFSVENSKSIEPGKQETFSITVDPPEDALQRNYIFNVFVNAGRQTMQTTGQFRFEKEHDLQITSLTTEETSYNPGEEVEYRVELLNTGTRTVENYDIRLEIGNSTGTESGIPVSPRSRASMRVSAQLEQNTLPGKEEALITIIRDEETAQTVKNDVNVNEITDIERTRETENRVLVYSRSLKAENRGNHYVETELNETIPRYLAPITVFETQPETVETNGDTNIYQWSANLEPGETQSVSYTVRYWIPAALLTGFMIGLLALKKLRTPVKISKSSKETDKGITIHIEIENASNETIKNLEVKDFIPDIAKVTEDFPMAKPVIRKTSNGTRLTWEIEELEPGDQRVFEYRIEPLFEVEGEVTLPEAELKTENKTAESSKIEVGFKPSDT